MEHSEQKKIAVVTMGVKLGNETKGYDRFKFLSTMLVNSGYHVDLITTSFQHWEKDQRNIADPSYSCEPFNVVFIQEPGYKKNIDPARVFSHAKAARNLEAYFREHDDYDLVYSEIPPNDVSLVCAKFAEKQGIPYVADVNDLWPEAMRMVLDVPVLSDLLFYPLARDAKETYRRCAAVVGTSDEYATRPLRDLGGSNEQVKHITVYVGNEISVFDEEARQESAAVIKSDNEFWVTYAGTIGASYDIKTMVLAADLLKKLGHKNIVMKILGGGPDKDDLEALASKLGCRVDFVGYMPHGIMAAYLVKSDILVNSFVRKAPQSIVTKIGDYLAAGKPMINTCMSPEFRSKVESDGFGVNVEPEDPEVLAQAILDLMESPELRLVMGNKARSIAETEFDRPVAYKRIVQLIGSLIDENTMGKAR